MIEWSLSSLTLNHPHRLLRKENFIFWTDTSILSNAVLFLSFHIDQKRHNTVALHALFILLSIFGKCQLLIISLTMEGMTQKIPNTLNNRLQSLLVTSQWSRRWLMFSSSHRHKKHLLGKEKPLRCTLSRVKIFPHHTSHAKKATLVGTTDFQIKFLGKVSTPHSSWKNK